LLRDVVKAVTGWDITIWEVLKVGERAITMARCFNIHEGFTRNDDTLPERFFKPLRSGNMKGKRISKDEFKRSLKLFYEMTGVGPGNWDPYGSKTL